MGRQEKMWEFAEQRQALLKERNKILEKLNSEKEKGIKENPLFMRTVGFENIQNRVKNRRNVF